jgi:hypothetical protein
MLHSSIYCGTILGQWMISLRQVQGCVNLPCRDGDFSSVLAEREDASPAAIADLASLKAVDHQATKQLKHSSNLLS